MKEYALEMTTTEIKPITVNVTDLQTGETVSSANVTHIPPSGNALTISSTVASPNINMLFGPFSVKGEHLVKVQAVGGAASPSKPEVVFRIQVRV